MEWRERRTIGSLALVPAVILLCALVGEPQTSAMAAETVFLQNGRTIQADKVEIMGDTVRIHEPAKTFDLPRSEVLSIHSSNPPQVSSGPANVYGNMTQQMNDQVRREIGNQPGTAGSR